MQETSDLAAIPVVIFCGGFGILVEEGKPRINKSLVQVMGEPMVAHVMRLYVKAGFRNFTLAGGYQVGKLASVLDEAYAGTELSSDGIGRTLTIAGQSVRVNVVDAGVATNTAERLKACLPYIQGHDRFCLTYSDTLSDVNLKELVAVHKASGKIATLVAAGMPIRFRILGLRLGEQLVRGFARRPIIEMERINGGFYVFSSSLLSPKYLGESAVVLENEVLESLARDLELISVPHDGAWQNLDNDRDMPALERIAASI